MLRIGLWFASRQSSPGRGFDLGAAGELRRQGPLRRVGFQLIQQRPDPGSPAGTGQFRRQLITPSRTQPCVFFRVHGRCIIQDLLGELFRAAVRGTRCIGLHSGAVNRHQSRLHHPRPSTQAKDLTEQLGERVLMRRPETGDRRVIGKLVRRDHSKRDILACTAARSPGWNVHQRNTRTRVTPPSSTAHTRRRLDHPPDTPPRTPTRRARRRHPTRTTPNDPPEATPPTTAASTTTDRDHRPRSCKP